MLIKSLLSALGLVLVIEGIIPFIAPNKWRETVLLFAQQKNRFLRYLGFILMLIGLVIVILVHRLM